jgi:RNA polymerase sigma-70 factor (ECF subfamily)
MAQPSSLADLHARLRQGDDAAAAELYRRFAGGLINLARRNLDARTRRKVDPEDVMQSVFKSFFWRQGEGQFELKDWDSLWGLLVVITMRKCGHTVRHFRTGKRDVGREADPPAAENPGCAWEPLAKAPTPAHAAILSELLEELYRGLKERDRNIVQLRLQGFTAPEISTQVGLTEYTVEGVLRHVRKRLEKLRDEESQA